MIISERYLSCDGERYPELNSKVLIQRQYYSLAARSDSPRLFSFSFNQGMPDKII
jgi:hypothetical protein